MSTLRIISRWIVGLVFIFSGFVKGIDPMGTMFKIEDYFIAYGTEWAMPLAIIISIALCTIEFSTGVFLILNIKMKIVTWVVFSMMAAFTIMTFFDAIYEPVPDCGCFGDALIMTNWETFFKNVVLMIFVFIIIFTRKISFPTISKLKQNIITTVVILIFASFSVYSYNRLPILDFRDWKIGNDMAPDDLGKPITYLMYQNKQNGEIHEYLSNELPWQDTVWLANWEYVDTRIDDSNVIKGHELQIIDIEDNDVTNNYIENIDFQFILTAFDLEKAERRSFDDIKILSQKADENGFSFILLTSALNKDIDEFKQNTGLECEIFNSDDIVLKTMIRSNPGLMLIKDGVILDKWHYYTIPDFDEINRNYLSK